MTTATSTTISGSQVGNSLPRLEARRRSRDGRNTPIICGCGLLFGRIFRSTVTHGKSD
jgi:hypothetical protein